MLAVALSILCTAYCFGADPGEVIFRANRCGVCHKAERSTSNPSLKDISQAYRSQAGRLQKYLQGESAPVMNSSRAGVMKRYVEKTKFLSELERKSLVDFIMSH
jgi:cytochrome c551/c552